MFNHSLKTKNKPSFTFWETRPAILVPHYKYTLTFSTVVDNRIIVGSAYRNSFDASYLTTLDVLDIENDPEGNAIHYDRMPMFDCLYVCKEIKITSDIICIRDFYRSKSRTRALPLKNNPEYKWTQLPQDTDTIIQVSPNRYFCTRTTFDDYLEVYEVKEKNTLPTNQKPGPSYGGMKVMDFLQPLAEDTAISVNRYSSVYTWKLIKKGGINFIDKTSVDIDKESDYFSSVEITHMIPIDTQTVILGVNRCSWRISLDEKTQETPSVEILNLKTKQTKKLFNMPTTKFLLSDDKNIFLHYYEKINGFTLFNLKNLQKSFFELPQHVKPIGILNDRRVVCDIKNNIGIFDLTAQYNNYLNILISIFIEPLSKMIMEYCGDDFLLPTLPDMKLSSRHCMHLPLLKENNTKCVLQ